jgi:hypothetical protein
MQESLDSMAVALRVLAEITEGRHPEAADLEQLLQWAPDATEMSPDELACEVILRGIRRREALRDGHTRPRGGTLSESLVVADEFQESLRLRAETKQSRIDLIRADLGLCLTLVDLAATEYRIGNWEHAERTIAKAEKGYSDMLRLFSEATGKTAEVETELGSKFNEVRERLDGLKRLQ